MVTAAASCLTNKPQTDAVRAKSTGLNKDAVVKKNGLLLTPTFPRYCFSCGELGGGVGGGVEDFQVQLVMFWLAWKDADPNQKGRQENYFFSNIPDVYSERHSSYPILSKCWLSTYLPFCFSSWTPTIEIFLLFLGTAAKQNQPKHLSSRYRPCCDTAPQLSRQSSHFH